jgi:hypothetical protein
MNSMKEVRKLGAKKGLRSSSSDKMDGKGKQTG